MTIQDTLPHVQAVRRVYDNGHSTSGPNTTEVFHLPCHLDPSLNKDILLWDDIVSAFKGDIVHIRSGTMILPYLKGPEFKNLDPLRIAAVPGVTLDVVLRGRLEEKELSLESLQKALPGAPQQGHLNNPAPVFNASAIAYIKRNPSGGLFEAAWENYNHINNPDAGPPRRGPQATRDNQGAIINDNNNNNESNSNIHTGAKGPNASSNSISLARPPQELTSVTAHDITEIMISARLGDMHAQIALGEMYKDGRGIHQDYEAAMDWYLKAAEQGLASAQFKVGDMYAYGRGVPQDFTKAMVWFLKAAAQDYAPAQSSIGHLYQNEQGVLQDFHEAMNWYIKAADQGNAAAQNGIGWLYFTGRGVPQDYPAAMEWYLKAANQGHAKAQSNIGLLYQAGYGVPQDYSTAMAWYLKAANQGHAIAQCHIGWLYLYGQGVSLDYSQAMSWYRKAADQGHATAQTYVAWIYEQGLGVPKDKAKAIEWYRKAVAGGDAGAKVAVDRLEQQ